MVLERDDLIEDPGPGCADGGVEPAEGVGDAVGERCPIAFSPEHHGCREELSMVAGSSGERVPDSLENSGSFLCAVLLTFAVKRKSVGVFQRVGETPSLYTTFCQAASPEGARAL